METKICVRCREELPREAFQRNKNKSDGFSIYCRQCASWMKQNPQKPQEDFPDGHRRCNQCQVIKPFDAFHKSTRGRFGRNQVCIACRSRAQPKPEAPALPEGYQLCANCGELKPATPEFFKASSRRATGIGTQCRECARTYSKAWREQKIEQEPDYVARQYASHRNENMARARRYYETHKDQHRARQKLWEIANAERNKIVRREYALQNRERAIERVRQWRRDNPERYREYNQKWLEANPAKAQIISTGRSARRRARKKALPVDFTLRDWEFCLEYWHKACAVCGGSDELHADHWIAISSPNCPGTVRENMIVLCEHCNLTKQAAPAERWLTEKLGAELASQKLQSIQAYFEHIKTVKIP